MFIFSVDLYTDLRDACGCGDIAKVHSLFVSNEEQVKKILSGDAEVGQNECLYMAAEKGHHEIVKLLINYSSVKNESVTGASKAIAVASKNGHLKVNMYLLINQYSKVKFTLSSYFIISFVKCK